LKYSYFESEYSLSIENNIHSQLKVIFTLAWKVSEQSSTSSDRGLGKYSWVELIDAD
jgi:hypothetical protein